jgi:hypothetical protein
MKDKQLKYILKVLGLPVSAVKKINAGNWSCVTRNRIFISNVPTDKIVLPPQKPSPWDPGWAPSRHTKDHELVTWLRTRGVTDAGNHVLTSVAYSPLHLVYRVQHFGGEEAFSALWEGQRLLPNIDWSKYVPQEYAEAWQVILDWPVQKQFFPGEKEDLAAQKLADLFADPLGILPFRPPNLGEKLRESEFDDFYDDIVVAAPFATEKIKHDLIGNFFVPSALKTACGLNSGFGIQEFLSGQETSLHEPVPISPQQMKQEFESLYKEAYDDAVQYLRDAYQGKQYEEKKVRLDKLRVPTPNPVRAIQWDEAYIKHAIQLPAIHKPRILPYKPLRAEDLPIELAPTAKKVYRDFGAIATDHYPRITPESKLIVLQAMKEWAKRSIFPLHAQYLVTHEPLHFTDGDEQSLRLLSQVPVLNRQQLEERHAALPRLPT